MKNLFLISSSRYQGGEFYAHCLSSLKDFLGIPKKERSRIVFIPYADPDKDYDRYTKTASEPFKKLGYELFGVHSYNFPADCFYDDSVAGVCIGGGNTWLLQDILWKFGFHEAINGKVSCGEWKYIGASAGTVMACPSMLTTNDMAPILPSTDKAIGLVPFQINPHFVSGVLVQKHMGETREERIRQMIVCNPDWQVIGLPEGCWIEGKDKKYILRGTGQGVIFRKDGNNSIWQPAEFYDKVGML